MSKLQKFSEIYGLRLVRISSAWDIHSCGHLSNLCKKKGTNLHKTMRIMVDKGYRGGFTLVVGKIGRSQHNKTVIGIFEGIIDGYEYDEIFINEPNMKYWSNTK